jgi:DNA polymerase
VHLWHRDHPWIPKSERPDELLDRIAAGEIFEAHNAKFEYLVWNYVLMCEFPEFDVPLQLEQMRCSAAKASCLSLPRQLGDAANAVGLENRKDTDGKRLIAKLSKPKPKRKNAPPGPPEFCEEEIEHRRNWAYCEQDVRTERDLSKWCDEAMLSGGMTQQELDYWLMDFRMNERGIRLDRKAAADAVKMCATEVARLDSEMYKLSKGTVLGGSKRIPWRKWANEQIVEINKQGQPMDLLPDTKADTVSFALYGVPTKAAEEAKVAKKPEMDAIWGARGLVGMDLKRGMEICLEVNRSSVSKFKTMNAAVCPDGRLHDIMLYNGADRTGRWSGQGVQPHNFVRGYSKAMPEIWRILLDEGYDRDFVEVVTGDLMLPTLAKACRGALIASDGMELYAADFNAIEARKLAWMASCASQLTLFNTEGGDPYVDMASAIYDIPVDISDPEAVSWFKKEHASKRQLGKKAVLGLGYAMGAEKFQTTVYNEEGIFLDDEFCQKVVDIYRKQKCPEIPVLWKNVGKAAIAAVKEGGEHFAGGNESGDGQISYFVNGRFLHCRLPSGRLLAYLDPEVHSKVNYRFKAVNERGKDCTVHFHAKMGVPMNRVRDRAELLAERQRKTLTGEPPETYVSDHLSFMGRHIITKQWTRLGTHGGSLVENADQASSRDLLAAAMWRVDQDGRFGLLLSIHDEVIAEAPFGCLGFADDRDKETKAFEAIMAAPVYWAPGMPITAEGWIGPRLRK